MVTAADPERDRTAGSDRYAAAVEDWQQRRAAAYRRMIAEELPDGGTGGFLVWGDPALYDGTLRILDRIAGPRRRRRSTCVSVPGISSVQALAARHRVALNRTGAGVHRDHRAPARRRGPAARRRRRGRDAGRAGRRSPRLPDADLDIYWGAYVGTAGRGAGAR